jgi:hypothetical protein
MDEQDRDEIFMCEQLTQISPVQSPGSVARQAPKSEGASTVDM